MTRKKLNQLSGILVVTASTLLGIYSFIYPFLTPNLVQSASPSGIRTNESPLMLVFLLAISLLGLLSETQQGASSARMVALAGMLIAINSVLRFVEVAIPGPGGFSPIFFLIILSGYIFGAKIGFLIGALTLFVSALISGGVGPWLPSQMFTAGWVGMSSAVLPLLIRVFHLEGKKAEVGVLMIWGGLWGLAYGAIMNLWSWPFIFGTPDQSWSPGMGWQTTLQRYAVFYLATSLIWDLSRAFGNALLIGVFGRPTLQILRRFKTRFRFSYEDIQDCPSQLSPYAQLEGEPRDAARP
ncbi:MAG: ECF transporter S component [Anaerolineales bacterium]